MYNKDLYEAKYQFLIIKSKGLKDFNDPKAFIEYANDMQDVYKNIEEYNTDKECKILSIIKSIGTELFIRGRKLNVSLVFITQSYFKIPKDFRLNSTHFFIMKIPNKRELQQIAINHSSDISTKDFINIYRECTAEPYSFLVNDATLASDNPLRFRKNLFNM